MNAAVFVSVSLLSCFGRDHGNGGPASRYDDQDGEFPEVAWTQERFDWRWQSCDPRKGKFSLHTLEVKPERLCVLSHFSRVWLFATPWTTAHQAPVRGILQAWILEWVATSSSRGSSQPRDQTRVSYVSCIGSWTLDHQRHLGSPKKDLQWLTLEHFEYGHPKIKICPFWSGLLPHLGRQLGKCLEYYSGNSEILGQKIDDSFDFIFCFFSLLADMLIYFSPIIFWEALRLLV